MAPCCAPQPESSSWPRQAEPWPGWLHPEGEADSASEKVEERGCGRPGHPGGLKTLHGNVGDVLLAFTYPQGASGSPSRSPRWRRVSWEGWVFTSFQRDLHIYRENGDQKGSGTLNQNSHSTGQLWALTPTPPSPPPR